MANPLSAGEIVIKGEFVLIAKETLGIAVIEENFVGETIAVAVPTELRRGRIDEDGNEVNDTIAILLIIALFVPDNIAEAVLIGFVADGETDAVFVADDEVVGVFDDVVVVLFVSDCDGVGVQEPAIDKPVIGHAAFPQGQIVGTLEPNGQKYPIGQIIILSGIVPPQ